MQEDAACGTPRRTPQPNHHRPRGRCPPAGTEPAPLSPPVPLNPSSALTATALPASHPSGPGGEALRSALPLSGPSAPPRPAASVPPVPGRPALRGAGPGAMSHGARVIRTGVSSAGPAAPTTAASSTASAGSDGELVDGAYFRSCAGMLKVAQMVRGRTGGSRWSLRGGGAGAGHRSRSGWVSVWAAGRGVPGLPPGEVWGLRVHPSALAARHGKQQPQLVPQRLPEVRLAFLPPRCCSDVCEPRVTRRVRTIPVAGGAGWR